MLRLIYFKLSNSLELKTYNKRKERKWDAINVETMMVLSQEEAKPRQKYTSQRLIKIDTRWDFLKPKSLEDPIPKRKEKPTKCMIKKKN